MASLGISYGKVWLTMGEWSDSMFYNKSRNTVRKTIESLSLLIRFGMQCVCMMTRKWNWVINPLFGASFIGCLELVNPAPNSPSPNTLICFCRASLCQSRECITMTISIFLWVKCWQTSIMNQVWVPLHLKFGGFFKAKS
jgi:hypothetical protein